MSACTIQLLDSVDGLPSGALSVKMSILLYLPGLLVIVFKRKGLATTLRHLFTIIAIQALLASAFLSEDPWSYLKGAFDLGRVFLYKWTVNWRFIDEPAFLSPTFALTLLVGHVSVLVSFGLFKWCKLDGSVWKVLDRGLRRPLQPAGLAPVTADCESFQTSVMLSFSQCDCRYCYRLVHFKFDWHSFCTVVTLPVLFLVLNANTLSGLEDSISSHLQVSMHLRYRPNFLANLLKTRPPVHDRICMECLPFHEYFLRRPPGWEFVIAGWGVVWVSKWCIYMSGRVFLAKR